jgi:phosphoribosylanthranilate isomerase
MSDAVVGDRSDDADARGSNGTANDERRLADGGEAANDGTRLADGGTAAAERRRPRVKVCGITNASDRDAAVAAGADAIGVICDVPVDTPRAVDSGTATDLVAGVPPLVTSVLVTMPETVQAATRLARTVEPDAVQVHGGLSPPELGALSRRLNAAVIAGVDADADAAELAAYADAADALLVDSVDPEGGGGTGETHDWDRTADAVTDLDAPVLLAGGLTPDNVAEAVATVDPFGVDVASGVEREGGVKDHDAVAAFVAGATAVDPDHAASAEVTDA